MKIFSNNSRKNSKGKVNGVSQITVLLDPEYDIYVEEYFREILCMERKRAERSMNPFVLMLLDIEALSGNGDTKENLSKIFDALLSSTREIDIKGWYITGQVMGVIFPETDKKELDALKKKLFYSVSDPKVLGSTLFSQVKVSFHVFPQDRKNKQPELPFDHSLYPELPFDHSLYPELFRKNAGKKGALFIKRVLDVVGSILGILIFLPFFIVIPVLMKLTSKGPILFKQSRIGAFGESFTFLKFRSMYVNNDETIHAEYVKKLITGQSEHDSEGKKEKVYKIQNDQRVTPLGRFLRKTSLDELPQFFNVLRGDMSLVGPRPPIPYELENYDAWHLRRVLEFKPGITGLWQVKGRSRTTFNEMVRMDIRYIRMWSIWMDIRLILLTPWSMITSKGAF